MKFFTRLVSVGVAASMSVLFLGQSAMAEASSSLDVRVEYITLPNTLYANESVTIAVTFKNTGADYSGVSSWVLNAPMTTTDFTITSVSDDYYSKHIDTFPANALDTVHVTGYFRHSGTVDLTTLIAQYVQSLNISGLHLASGTPDYVTVQPAATPKPDFTVDSMTVPSAPQVGEAVTIDVYFKNIGAPMNGIGGWVIDPLFNTGNFSITSSVDDYATRQVQTWQTNGIDHVKLNGHFVRSGQFNLTATYDNGNGIAEANETNNSKSAYVFVQPALSYQLIKASSSSSVYWYEKDRRARYTYPDEATYHTWFSSFTNITVLSDSDMATIPLKGMVTVKPGSALVKIATDPKVYAVDAGSTLRWIKTEELARALYGTDWNKKVLDIDVGLFGKYLFGSDISSTTDYDPNSFSQVTTGSVLR